MQCEYILESLGLENKVNLTVGAISISTPGHFPLITEQVLQHTVVAKSFRTPRVFTLNPMLKKSGKIECCDLKIHQIVQNMILTWGLELNRAPTDSKL